MPARSPRGSVRRREAAELRAITKTIRKVLQKVTLGVGFTIVGVAGVITKLKGAQVCEIGAVRTTAARTSAMLTIPV